MNSKTTYTIVAIATLAALLITTSAASSAYAWGHHHYSKTKQSQSLAQANACGNGPLPYKVDCQNSGSQIQGKRNAASVASSQ